MKTTMKIEFSLDEVGGEIRPGPLRISVNDTPLGSLKRIHFEANSACALPYMFVEMDPVPEDASDELKQHVQKTTGLLQKLRSSIPQLVDRAARDTA